MNRPLHTICITHMFLEIFFNVQVALIPAYLREFHLTLVEASLVAAIPSTLQLVMNIPAGLLVNRVNTRHMLSTSMLIEGFSAMLLSQTTSFWSLVVCASLMRLSSPIYHISGLSQIGELSSKDQTGRSMGFHNAMGSLGSSLGLVSLSLFLSTLGWRWAYLFWSIPIILWGVVLRRSAKFDDKPAVAKQRTKLGVKAAVASAISTGFLVFLISISLREIGVTGASTFMTTYLVRTREISESMASLVFGLGPFMGIVGALAGGYLCGKMSARKMLSLVIIGSVATLTTLSVVSQIVVLSVFYVVYSFFISAAYVPMNTMVLEITSPKGRGAAFSVFFFTEGLMVSVAPVITGSVVQSSGALWYFFPFAIVFFLAGLTILQRVPSKWHSTLSRRG